MRAFIPNSLVWVKLNMLFTLTKVFRLFSGLLVYSWGIGSVLAVKNSAIIIICSSVSAIYKHFVLPKSGVINSTFKEHILCICRTAVWLKGPTGERWLMCELWLVILFCSMTTISEVLTVYTQMSSNGLFCLTSTQQWA